jgi:small-conductance mechanosensitive channel
MFQRNGHARRYRIPLFLTALTALLAVYPTVALAQQDQNQPGAASSTTSMFDPQHIVTWLGGHWQQLVNIVLIVIGMLVLRRVVRFGDRRLVDLIARTGRGPAEDRENRAQTLVGVFHNVTSVLIVVGGLLLIVATINKDWIAPLLGALAVVGIAVGLGTQNLVRDYFHGFVLLLENQYTVNDVVKIGDTSGLVERITLRMTVLRDLEGTAHFIPHGQIATVSNMTHHWSRAVLEIGVAYKEDVDRVMEVLLQLGRELRQDPAFADLILEDPEMLGVDAFGDSAVVIKFFLKTRPLKQWAVKRELQRRIKNKFDELGIEIPFPHRTLFVHQENGASQAQSDAAS